MHGIEIEASTVKVACAGSSNTLEACGIVRCRMKLKMLNHDLLLHAIELPSDLHVCLGDSWLHEHGAILTYDEGFLQLRKGEEEVQDKI